MKVLLRYSVLVVMMFCLQAGVVNATTYDWIGNAATGSKTDWNNILNWQVLGALGLPTTPSTPPQSGDPVNIGLLSFSNPPAVLVNTTATCASITFGALIPSLLSSVINFAVDGTLTVSGDIYQSPALLSSYTVILSGGGRVDCLGNLKIGDQGIFLNNILTATTNVLTFASTITNLNIAKNVSVNGTTFGINLVIIGLILGEIDATFSLRGGTTSIGGKILTTNTSGGILNNSKATVKFYVEPSSGNATLKLGGPAPIDQSSLANSLDFYKSTGTGTCTVEYNDDDNTAGTTQTVYASTDPILDNNPATYNYLTMSNRVTKKVNAGTLTVDKNWISSGGIVDLTSNNPIVTVGGNWTNSCTVNQGSGKITITGSVINNSGGTLNLGIADLSIATNYTNNTGGIYTQSTGTTIFNGTANQTLRDFTTVGTKFNNVTFTGASTKTMNYNTGGNFSVSPKSTLTVTAQAVLGVTSDGTARTTALTMLSTAAGDASIANMSTGSIIGSINVQRYVTGVIRRYMLLSSPVNNASATTYSLVPLKATTFITGPSGAGNGFDDAPATGNSPSAFVYDENAPITQDVNSTNGNEYKPFATINESVPLANGLMYYFRGSRSIVNPFIRPFPAPDNTTLNFFGTVFKGTGAPAGTTGQFTANIINFPSTPPATYTSIAGTGTLSFNAATPIVKRGLNLLGNPYASVIDLQKVYSVNVAINSSYAYKFYYMLVKGGSTGPNSYSTKFAVYDASTGSIQPGANRYALSGQGFFVAAPGAYPIVFNETMKVSYSSYTGSSPTLPVFNVKNLNNITSIKLASSPRQTSLNEASTTADNTPASVPPIPSLRLELNKDTSILNTTDINFVNEANNTFRPGEDAPYLLSSGQGDLLYSFTTDSIGCFVNYMSTLEKLKRVNLSVEFSNYGLYKITAPSKANIDERYTIFLKDKYTNDSLDVVHNSEYAFNVDKNAASYAHDRFYLSIGIAPGHEYKLLGFSGTKVAAGIQLTWKTDNESTFTRFLVEKSTNGGKSYITIDSLLSTGAGSYTFTDPAPGTGQITYRLVQVLVSGDTQISKSLTFDFSASTELLSFMVYPSNTVQDIHIRLGKMYSNNIKINIINAVGSVVKTLTTSNTDVVQQNVGNLIKGMYIVDAIDEATGKRIGSAKFFKQ
ncbi:hypothetical protein SNE25_13755 [Mucilaginibacter sabulilitoris]|uniref:Secretion system C-terminal sorting domain-containing protein n=1 Tax=Mucilaginibacter sabulilitoris TaxID=1173583 RepID=A0ABZ0TTZ7_9SPHI|nr:hypothetical protein [Mucilaginibacter sabulilitoris]WPU96584.1 hypothetical protein SNE25_13755 [Mucilaginibacter sabulilitoris]